MTHTEIVKEKLKGCGEEIIHIVMGIIYCGNLFANILHLCPTCKANLSGMQTAIKSELEWLKLHRDSDNACFNLKNLKPKSKKLEEGYKASLECQIGIYDKRITDCKNALKLIEEK